MNNSVPDSFRDSIQRKIPVEDILQWDVKSWVDALDYWEKKVNWNKIEIALELGGRQGGLSLWLASKGINVTCSDLENTKSTALLLHEKYQTTDKIKYEDIDACNVHYENHFDLIVFKSILGGIGRKDNIENQQRVFEQSYKALKPGGVLLFAENLVASPLHMFFRKKFVKWSADWRYVTIEELRDFLKLFSEFEIKSGGFSATFGRTESQRNFLSVFDKMLFNYIVPSTWKYIAFGIARK